MAETDMLSAVKAVLDDTVLIDHRYDTEELARDCLAAAGLSTELDQPMPLPTDLPDGAHDRAIEWLMTTSLHEQGRERGDVLELVAGLTGRKAFGLRKYRTTLQPGNSRDNAGDLLGELLDAVAYAQNGYDAAVADEDWTAAGWWWRRRSRACDEAIEVFRFRHEHTPGSRSVRLVEPGAEHIAAEGDEAALTVRREATGP